MIRIRLFWIAAVFLCSPLLYAQNAHLDHTNRDYLLQKSALWRVQSEREYSEALQIANEKNWPISIKEEDGSITSLIKIERGLPLYLSTTNLSAAQMVGTHHLWEGGSTGLDLEGGNMVIGEWDGGDVLDTHQEFIGRVQLMNAPSPNGTSSHATHVAGTLIAGGVNSSAKGMAPKATVKSYDWFSDVSEMAAEAADGLLLSNHSYGYLTGWASGKWYDPDGPTALHWWGDPDIDAETDWKFGFYDFVAQNWDDIAYNAPYYLIVKSAGNDRNDTGSGEHYVRDSNGDWVLSSDFRNPDGDYDCLPRNSNAKNILTIGAVNGSGSMSSFSGWGPTDDGRIKPDVVGKGVSLFSARSTSDTAYGNSSGTSMSGPNVAGSLLLLQEHAHNLYGEYLRAASLKGLAIHTASPLTNGPSYSFGWGLINSEAAANFLTNSTSDTFKEMSMTNGEIHDFTYYYNGIDDLKVTISWTDPPGIPHDPALDNPAIKLIHDLDIRLIDPVENITYFPYTLDPFNPSADATTGDNIRDNVEMISIEGNIIPAGAYIVEVSHKGTIGGSQDFTLLVSGLDDITALSVNFITANAKYKNDLGIVSWDIDDASDVDYFEIERSLDNAYQFKTIGRIENDKSNRSAYTFNDMSLPQASKVYYRIKAIDKAAQMTHSPIVNLPLPGREESLLVYPNPGRNGFHLKTDKDVQTMVIYDIHGKVHQLMDSSVPITVQPNIYTIQFTDLSPGLYTIQVIYTDGSTNASKWINK